MNWCLDLTPYTPLRRRSSRESRRSGALAPNYRPRGCFTREQEVDMIVDDLMWLTVLAGLALSCVHMIVGYSLWRRNAQQQRNRTDRQAQ